jgi:hypothetical protein
MTELPGCEDIDYGSPVRGQLSQKALVVVSGLALLPAIYALVLSYTLLSGTALNEGPWWLLFFGVVAAYGFATPPALRLWKRRAEELRRPGSGRQNSNLRGREHAPAVAGGDEGRAERQLLEAIDRHGEITPVRAALETTLTVDEADRMLSDLAKSGYLEVRVEGGKLLYGL